MLCLYSKDELVLSHLLEITDQQERSGQQGWACGVAFPWGLPKLTIMVTFVSLAWASAADSVRLCTQVCMRFRMLRWGRTKWHQVLWLEWRELSVKLSPPWRPNLTFLPSFWTTPFNRTFCGDGSVLYQRCPVWWLLATWWLLSPWNVANMMENWKFSIQFNLMNLNLNDHIWPVATVLDSATLDGPFWFHFQGIVSKCETLCLKSLSSFW